MAAYARLIRVLHNSSRRGRCKHCRRQIVFVLDDQGKWKPFDPGAAPLRAHEDDRGVRYDIYEPTAFHQCPNRPAAGAKSTNERSLF